MVLNISPRYVEHVPCSSSMLAEKVQPCQGNAQDLVLILRDLTLILSCRLHIAPRRKLKASIG